MKIAVLGATGMAGHVISQYFKDLHCDVYETSRSIRESEKAKAIDACDTECLVKWLNAIEPDVIVNAIGLLQRACAERPDLAIKINSYLPQRLAFCFKDTSAKIIHLSTDCVFSGANAPYEENSFRDGDTLYDRTKALGEIINSKDLTFRMSIIGPDIDPQGTGLFNWFCAQTGKIGGYSKAFWNGITTIELAKAIEKAIEAKLIGLYHLVPQKNISKYDLIILFKKYFDRQQLEIYRDDSFSIDKTLKNTRADFKYYIPAYDEMIEEMAEWVKKHRDMYWF